MGKSHLFHAGADYRKRYPHLYFSMPPSRDQLRNVSVHESKRQPRRYASSITGAILRSPLAITPSRTVTCASCQLYFRLLRFSCSRTHHYDVRLRSYSSAVYMDAHWNGVNGFGTKKEELAVIWHFPCRCSSGFHNICVPRGQIVWQSLSCLSSVSVGSPSMK